ncbi:MAG: hypothetical protein IJ762_02170 [Bacteroidaceae bacterium]|nr:hypothetical protein [Bacteroidaceae bacterium]
MKRKYQKATMRTYDVQTSLQLMESSYIEVSPTPGGFDVKEEQHWHFRWV